MPVDRPLLVSRRDVAARREVHELAMQVTQRPLNRTVGRSPGCAIGPGHASAVLVGSSWGRRWTFDNRLCAFERLDFSP